MDLPGVPNFEPTGETGAKWRKWRKSFEYYVQARGIQEPARKKALLLHCAGPAVQDIFDTLAEVEEDDEMFTAEGAPDYNEYIAALTMLDRKFLPQVNESYERHRFRRMKQTEDETVEQYIVRLKYQASLCNFGARIDDDIRDQVIDGCRSSEIRTKLLERGRDLTLERVREIAAAYEMSHRQAKDIEKGGATGGVEVNAVQKKCSNTNTHSKYRPTARPTRPTQFNQTQQFTHRPQGARCYRCDKTGHFARDRKCPARKEICKKCSKVGHFARCCKSTPPGSDTKVKGVYSVKEAAQETETLPYYAFSIEDGEEDECEVDLVVGGVKMSLMVDSGSTINIVDKKTWSYLKGKKIQCTSEKCTKDSKEVFPYGSKISLPILGKFTAEVQTKTKSTQAVFAVLDGEGRSIIGRRSAKLLGILRVGEEVGEEINSMENRTTDDILRNFPTLFEGIGKLNNFQLKLHINEEIQPVAQSVRRVPFSLREKVKQELNRLLEEDVIERVKGPTPWVNPLVIVPKPGGDVRICVDMRRANEAIIRERHPIPTTDEVVYDLNQSKVFSKLDLKCGFHQIELTEASRQITTFVTHEGLFRYKRLMFGISSAPEIYNHIIQQVLQGCEGARNISDDIIVHGRTIEEHNNRLVNVLNTLKENGLTLNREKCQFNMPHLMFMGHVLSAKGIGLADEKFKAIMEAREPQNPSEVRSFLGLVQFCARYICDYSTLVEPLRRLTRLNTKFEWGPEQAHAFKRLKEELAGAEILAYFDSTKKTQVIADASPFALGAVLVQGEPGEQRIVSYASKSLTDVERRYSQTEREALAVVWACERFHVYLYGIEFELLTDHKPLETIYSIKSKPSARIERWVLRLQSYNFKVKYIPGKQNIADSLSRLVDKTSTRSEKNDAEEYIRFVAENTVPKAMSIREIERESEKDPELQEVRRRIKNNDWSGCLSGYKYVREELTSLGQLVLRGTRLVMPCSMRKQTLMLAHEGHQGIVKTKSRLRSKVWWPGIDKQAEKLCKACHNCQIVGQPMSPEHMTRKEMPENPWEDLAADLLGPLPTGEYILVVVDYFSRYFEVAVMRSITSSNVIDKFQDMFATHGLPYSIRTDNGPQFVSDEMENYLKENDIEHVYTTACWPQANGEVERQNRSLLKAMKTAQNWKKELRTFLVAYRSTPHSTTGVAPATLLYRRDIRTKLPCLAARENLSEEVLDRDWMNKVKGKEYSDKKRRACESDLKPGDKVLLQQRKENKLSTVFESEPYVISGRNGSEITVHSPSKNVTYTRNISQVKPYIEQTDDTQENDIPVMDEQDVPGNDIPVIVQSDTQARPTRNRKPPDYLQDYVWKK